MLHQVSDTIVCEKHTFRDITPFGDDWMDKKLCPECAQEKRQAAYAEQREATAQ